VRCGDLSCGARAAGRGLRSHDIANRGHGMNTGVADAVDLSWMLDAILNGWGDEGLLSAYDSSVDRSAYAIHSTRP